MMDACDKIHKRLFNATAWLELSQSIVIYEGELKAGEDM